MKTLIFCISLLFCCTSNIYAINNQEKKYQLSAVEFIDRIYTARLTFTYQDNKLTKVIDDYSYGDGVIFTEWYEFDYSRMDKQIVTMIDYYDNWARYITLQLNSDGFVEKATYDDGEWYEFYYNSDKQLSCMIRHDKDILETTNITYNNGSLVKVNEDDGDAFYMKYTSAEISTPIDNKAGLMYNCDILWGVDLDEFNYVYIAGLLGKAPVYLPISINDSYGIEYHKWTLDENGIPLECNSNNKIYKYYWNTTETGINPIIDNAESATIDAIYSINGEKLKAHQKGLNIIRYSDGTIRKKLFKK